MDYPIFCQTSLIKSPLERKFAIIFDCFERLAAFYVIVHEKLKINLRESKEYLDKYQQLLWQISKYYLNQYAEFNPNEYSFILKKNPFPDSDFHPGPYRIGKKIDDSNIYRIGHPLAQKIISKCKAFEQISSELIFDYSGAGIQINILNNLVGKRGWLKLFALTIDSFEKEDHILLCGVDDDNCNLSKEQCKRLFSLQAKVNGNVITVPNNVNQTIEEITRHQEEGIQHDIQKRNEKFYNSEYEKMDSWAEDVKASLELELKQLEKEIKTLRTQSRSIEVLAEKVKMHQEIRKMEKKRNELRASLWQSQDEVDKKKETLMDEIEGRMKLKISTTELFTIKWSIV